MSGALNPGQVKRIAHIRSHLDAGFELDQLVHNIENTLGDPRACVMSLSGHAEASALYAWFEQRDLTSLRQWFHVAAKLDQKRYQMQEDKQGPGSKMLRLIKPLVSNDRSLIKWFAHNDEAFWMERVEKPSTHDFWAYQAFIAIRGEWERLAERCERVIRDPPRAAAEQKYLVDHEFYQALARRDMGAMTEVLKSLVTPKMIRARANDDSGYAEGLISTAAVIYAKIAWYHGYEVRVDSPYIPSEWLPMEPLDRYDDRYSFLRD
jgi:hypothetical protein